MDYEKLGAFFLGHEFDLRTKATGDAVMYDARDLTTHAVCVGMTGSGKTGLCIALIEEALIDGVPVIAIDPKGDLGNLMLSFPGLAPRDFEPWLDPSSAQRDGITVSELAAKTAAAWRAGLEASGQPVDRVARLRAAGEIAIYTPGSDAGIPLSVLRSLRAPAAAEPDSETYRDRIEATVSGLLALVGIAADPLRSREHILLSQLIDRAWRESRDLELAALIQAVTKPPFSQVGAFDLETFFPTHDRTELALQLNSLLASPSFAAWSRGEPLDIAKLLYTPQGKPRVAVLSIAHLGDAERMFFVTLVLQELISWMRSQQGTSSLRAIAFMDEVTGYLPPTAQPPSKKPMLTLLKQARAFGLGMVVATQNPVDLDYKALSNAGTWFLGRLQTERDKARVLEGLEGASAAAGKAFDRAAMEATLAGLSKRVFVMNNVHDDHPIVLQARWAMSFLAGPLSRAQIQTLTSAQRASVVPEPAPKPAATAATAATAAATASSTTRPVVPGGLAEQFLGGGALTPALRGTAKVHYVLAKYNIDLWRDVDVIAPLRPETAGDFWEHAAVADSASLVTATPEPDPDAVFAPLPPALSAKLASKLDDGLAAWLLRSGPLTLWSVPALKLVSHVGEAESEFRARVAQAQREVRDAAIDAIKAKYQPKLDALAGKLRTAQERVDRERSQAQAATAGSAISIGASVLGALFGGRRTSVSKIATAARSVSRTVQQRSDVSRADEAVGQIETKMADLQAELAQDVAAVQSAAEPAIESIDIAPKKADTIVTKIAILWRPTAPPEPVAAR